MELHPQDVPWWAGDRLPREVLCYDAPRTQLDWPGIWDEWLAACRQIVEDAIASMGTASYAARSRAEVRRQTPERMAWAAAAALSATAQITWTRDVWRAQNKQTEALMDIITKRMEVARG